MKITLVNHASTIYSHNDIHLITDPWIEGDVFQEGWSHLCETKFKYEDFERITHIWFSHEHPDHFFPPNIKSIPPEIIKNITVLYQETVDKKVLKFCKAAGFKEVIELAPNKALNLASDFTVTNAPFGHDSWLHVKAGEYTYFNTNDCLISDNNLARKIHNVVGDVDVLLTQFSYACKYGNADQPEQRREAAERKYDQMKLQIDMFKPKYCIPIASFVWFSHEENYYMNDSVNTIDKVEAFIKQTEAIPIVLYPEDTFTIGDVHDNGPSIAKYQENFGRISIDNARKTQTVALDAVLASGKKLSDQLKKEDLLGYFLMAAYPIKFYISDLKVAVKFSSLTGLKVLEAEQDDTNIIMTSEVLDYCLKFNWGFGTSNVNGRFQTVKEKDIVLFKYYVAITDALNHQDSTLKRVVNKVFRKFGVSIP